MNRRSLFGRIFGAVGAAAAAPFVPNLILPSAAVGVVDPLAPPGKIFLLTRHPWLPNAIASTNWMDEDGAILRSDTDPEYEARFELFPIAFTDPVECSACPGPAQARPTTDIHHCPRCGARCCA